MKKITQDVTHHTLNLFNQSKLHPFILNNLEEILVFDIETTGLHHKHCHVILIGYLYVKEGKIFAEQLFAEHPEEENKLLEAFKIISQSYTYHLSYNGNSFDIPFLNSRYQYNQIDYILDKSINIDLLRVARKLSKDLELENYKLKTVEEFLGIYREDHISGKESVELYNQYVYNPSESLRHTILLHNFEDILYLGKVVDLLGHQNFDDYSNIPMHFTYNSNGYYIKEYKVTKDFVSLILFSRNIKQKRIHFSPGQLTLEQSENMINLKAPIFKLSINDQTLSFLDIDLISDNQIRFNELSYEDKMCYLVSDDNMAVCIDKVFNLIDTY